MTETSIPLQADNPVRSALRLPRRLRQELADWALSGHPHEVCGLLVGRQAGGTTEVLRVTLARNLVVERRSDRYVLDPADFLTADAEARREGLDIVGAWHTHPDHPARPSPTDLEAAWEDFTYLILSVRAQAVDAARAWRLVGSGFVEQPIEEVSS